MVEEHEISDSTASERSLAIRGDAGVVLPRNSQVRTRCGTADDALIRHPMRNAPKELLYFYMNEE